MIRILFQGDSITDAGRNRLGRVSLAGYPKVTANILVERFGKRYFEFRNRGIGGDRSRNLLARYKRHFVKIKPDIVTVMIGINDVWRKYDRNDETPVADYIKNLTKLFKDIKQDLGAKIIVMSPYLVPNEKHDVMRHDVDVFINACKKVAEKYADMYVDTNSAMNEACNIFQNVKVPRAVSADGVHPTPLGEQVLGTLLADAISKLIKG